MNVKLLEERILDAIDKCIGRVSVAIDLPTHSIQINNDTPFSAASLIKVPILLEGFRQAEQGKIDLNETVMVPKEDRVGGAGVLSTLSENISLTVEDLLTLMIIVSDNTATNLIIDRIGSEAINNLCKSLALKHTNLGRKLMDFQAMEQGYDNFTSASDIITCLRILDKSPLFSEQSREKMLFILHQQQFGTKLPARMDRERVFIANKTGELPGVEHDCAIVRYEEKTAYIVVLIDGLGESESARDTIAEIGKLLFDYLTKPDL
ncbi:serine hydrolase [Rossellomorea aquimaris]|nr:serine hydrolase [Rossellomorea aquimaris]WRP04570.1 serine hydrolase [Rossellomorea aquimaris]